MNIGVTSQNFRTVTGHAGKTRRVLVYSVDANKQTVELDRLDLPKEMSMHEFTDVGPHPVDVLDALITGSCGAGFRRKMAARGIEVIATSETDPFLAVTSYASGKPLPPPEPHNHGK